MSAKEITTKICIIGGGFAGLLVANILQKYRISCVVVEKRPKIESSNRFKTTLIDSKSISILQKYGLGDRLLQEGSSQGVCEFRTPQQSFVLDYANQCDRQTHYVYSPDKLLVDLKTKLEQVEGEILLNTEAINITNDDRGAKVECRADGEDLAINCDFIVGCDGKDGISRASIAPTCLQSRSKKYNCAWLAVTAEAPAYEKHAVYGLHPQGFAGYMGSDETKSYYYLQVSKEHQITDWSHSRIWSELNLRLAHNDREIKKGKIIAQKILTLDSYITRTMQNDRLFLAGSSAHRMVLAGENKIDAAIQDGEVLSQALVSYYCYHQNSPLKNYSATRLSEIRKMQQFSESWLYTVNAQSDRNHQRVQQFKRSQLMNSEIYALDFARKYVGYTKPTSIIPVGQPFATAS